MRHARVLAVVAVWICTLTVATPLGAAVSSGAATSIDPTGLPLDHVPVPDGEVVAHSGRARLHESGALSRWEWGDLYWAVWIFVLFLIPELLGLLGVAPWPTLSSTAWHNQREYPILRSIIAGFLIGLAVHLRFQTPLWRAEAGGIGIAVLLHFAWVLI